MDKPQVRSGTKFVAMWPGKNPPRLIAYQGKVIAVDPSGEVAPQFVTEDGLVPLLPLAYREPVYFENRPY